jgi:hypothetical protein
VSIGSHVYIKECYIALISLTALLFKLMVLLRLRITMAKVQCVKMICHFTG